MNTITENDDKQQPEEELIPVETPPEAQEDDGDEHEEDDGDERLAESEEDTDEDVASGTTNRERRRKRREMQRRAREATKREVEQLREIVLQQQQRLAAVEGFATSNTVQSIEARIAQTQRDIQQAELIFAKAAEAGNGEDQLAAMKIRDNAMADLQKLVGTHQQITQRVNTPPPQPQIDPVVADYAKQWMAANPWYDPSGKDRDSALTKAIDNEIIAEGYDPKSREYWEELTARVADALGESKPKAKPQRGRGGPPVGNTREHAPVSSRKEIYVTPERKAAMQEAGVWDDPVLRQRYLKAYQQYDNGSAR